MQVTEIEVAKAIIAHEAVDCFIGKWEKAAKQPKAPTSCIGGAFWGLKGESWPVAEDGTPLFPWLQIVCSEMKGLYGAFFKKQAVSFFLKPDFDGYEEVSKTDQCVFVVREYGPKDKLVPLPRPKSLTGHRFRKISWKKTKDYPNLSKYYELFDDQVYDALCQLKRFKYANRSGIKIGGWPTPIQTDQRYPGEWDLQIDITSNYMYADSGIAYLSKSKDYWYVLFETC